MATMPSNRPATPYPRARPRLTRCPLPGRVAAASRAWTSASSKGAAWRRSASATRCWRAGKPPPSCFWKQCFDSCPAFSAMPKAWPRRALTTACWRARFTPARAIGQGPVDPRIAALRRPCGNRQMASRRARTQHSPAPADLEKDLARSAAIPYTPAFPEAPDEPAANLEQEERVRVSAGKSIPDFRAGDTLRVNVKIKEGERERVQAYEGVCIARSGARAQWHLHRPQDLVRRRRRAGVPDPFAVDRFHRGGPPGQGPPGEALLSARAARQIGPYRRAHAARCAPTSPRPRPSRLFPLTWAWAARTSRTFMQPATVPTRRLRAPTRAHRRGPNAWTSSRSAAG